MPVATYIIIAVVAVIVGFAIGLPIGIAYRKRIAEAQIGSAELQAKKIRRRNEPGKGGRRCRKKRSSH